MDKIKFVDFGKSEHLEPYVKMLYYNSFPVEERRPWESVLAMLSQKDSPYNVYVILRDDAFAGFISWWKLGRFVYIEHFAVKMEMRGDGVGSKSLRRFVDAVQMPVVLEVELPQCGELARRRIAFYSRNGFTAHPHFDYVQPSYGAGLPSVPLMLMTTNAPYGLNLQHVVMEIHQMVYGVNNQVAKHIASRPDFAVCSG